MGRIGRDDFYKIAGVKQHAEFEKFLNTIVLDKEKREDFYHKMLEIDNNVYVDSFRSYFEDYSAERKSNKQDYTPDTVSRLLATLTRTDPKESGMWSSYDPTAGTGSLLIQKWKDDMFAETPWSYAPHNYIYGAEEMADNAIPYLLHNLAIRGMNCAVVHGDTLERTAKQVYLVQNSDDDFLHFSDINVMPHSDEVKKWFNIKEWTEDPIDHIESGLVKFIPTELPMRRKKMTTDYEAPHESYDTQSDKDQLRLKDIASIERAKAKKVYPPGTIVIQISATRGQIGLLKSSGEVESKYACISVNRVIGAPQFVFYMLKVKAPRWFHRVKEDLNLKLDDIEKIPVTLTFAEREKIYEQMSLNLFGDEDSETY